MQGGWPGILSQPETEKYEYFVLCLNRDLEFENRTVLILDEWTVWFYPSVSVFLDGFWRRFYSLFWNDRITSISSVKTTIMTLSNGEVFTGLSS